MTAARTRPRAAVWGSPVAHSLSPVLHRAAYAELGLDWEYAAAECTAAELPARLESLDPSYAGLSLTMPLKTAVLPLLDEVSPLGATLGAVNTVLLRDGRRTGHNTDVTGVTAALTELGLARLPGRAVVLGAGGTARAVLAALAAVGVEEVVVLSRAAERARPVLDLGARLGLAVTWRPWTQAATAVSSARLVVATTPAGATDALATDALATDALGTDGWPGTAALVEVLYDPWPTALAAAALAAGAPIVGGLAVLVGQAAAQVTLMTGRTPSVPILRAAGEAALARRRGSGGMSPASVGLGG